MATKTYFIDRINNRQYPLNGVIPSRDLTAEIPAQLRFSSHILRDSSQLPPKVDLRGSMTAVEDQAQTNSCVANALAGAYEYLVKKSTGIDVDVSRLFVYYNARYRGGQMSQMTDNGCLIYHAVGSLTEYGTCLESYWPYEASRVNFQPNALAYQKAAKHKIVDWLQLQVNLYEMKAALAQGYPFTFGVELFNSFGYATQGGRVPMPTPAELDRTPSAIPRQHRFHAMLAVGYSDLSQMFLVRNSWGPWWGDQGYCYMPYAYLSNPTLCFDPWVIRRAATDDFSNDGWSFDDNFNYSEAFAPELLRSAPHGPPKWDIVDVPETAKPEEVPGVPNTQTKKDEAQE